MAILATERLLGWTAGSGSRRGISGCCCSTTGNQAALEKLEAFLEWKARRRGRAARVRGRRAQPGGIGRGARGGAAGARRRRAPGSCSSSEEGARRPSPTGSSRARCERRDEGTETRLTGGLGRIGSDHSHPSTTPQHTSHPASTPFYVYDLLPIHPPSSTCAVERTLEFDSRGGVRFHARPSASSARSVTVAPAPSASTTSRRTSRAVPRFVRGVSRSNERRGELRPRPEAPSLDVLGAGRAVFQHAFEKHGGVHPRRGSAHLLSQRRFPRSTFGHGWSNVALLNPNTVPRAPSSRWSGATSVDGGASATSPRCRGRQTLACDSRRRGG